MLANITGNLIAISKNRTVTATKSNVMELLYFKVSCIVHFPTHVALNGDYFMFSAWNLFVIYHYFVLTTSPWVSGMGRRASKERTKENPVRSIPLCGVIAR